MEMIQKILHHFPFHHNITIYKYIPWQAKTK